MYQKHVLIDERYKNKALCGHILCQVVYLRDVTTSWSETEKQRLLSTVGEVTNYLEKLANKEENVPLYFTIKTEELLCEATPLKCPTNIDIIHAKAHGHNWVYEFVAELKDTYNADEIVTLYVLKGPIWRAYACGSYCVVDQSSRVSTVLHEILHMFGAKDYYLPNTLRTIAEFCFPESVMLSGWDIKPDSIDPLTKFLIGWHQKPTPAAQFLLEQTSDMTDAQISTSRIVSKNKLDDVYKGCKPFQSFEDLQIAATVGDPWASFLLGHCFEKGVYVERNKKIAQDYYQRSFNGDCAPAGYALAELKLSQKELTHNDKATALQALLALQEDPRHLSAISLYACCLFSGFGLSERNLEYALSTVITNYNHFNYSNFDENTHFRKLPKTMQQHKLLEKLSQMLPELLVSVKRLTGKYAYIEKNGDPVMFYLMGRFLSDGTHPRPNPTRAFELFLKAAYDGFSIACDAVADCYDNGFGTQVNPIAAVGWRERAKQARVRENNDPDTQLQARILNGMV